MAEVTGSIGNNPVVLNNAATESTLQELIRVIQQSSGVNAATKAAQVATTAGINNANKQLQTLSDTASKSGSTIGKSFGYLVSDTNVLTKSFNKLETSGITPLIGKLVSGTAAVSDFYTTLSKLPGIFGTVFGVFQKVASFQEENLSAYQKLTNAGVNFGGSLTELRQSALNTYMTFDKFQEVVANNRNTLSKMGGTVEQGTRAFVNLSKSLLGSEVGDNLRSLGYTTDQVNEGMLNYINMTGGRNREELKNVKDITAASAEYLTQLDGLAQLTGKSREEQEKALKEANQNAAIQQKLAGMDEKQKAAYLKGLAEMEAKFGKAGREMFQAQVLGIAPQTEAARNLMALAPEVANASKNMAEVALRGGETSEVMKYSAQATEAAVEASKKFTNVAGAMSFRTDGVAQAINSLTTSAVQAEKQGRTTAQDELNSKKQIEEENKKRRESEAKAAIGAQKAVQELGQQVMAGLLPAIKELTPIVNKLVIGFSDVVGVLLKYKEEVGLLIAAYAALKLAFKANEIFKNYGKAREAGGSVLGSARDSVRGKLSERGHSIMNPLYVHVTNFPQEYGGRGRRNRRGGRGGGGRGGGGRGSTTSPPSSSTPQPRPSVPPSPPQPAPQPRPPTTPVPPSTPSTVGTTVGKVANTAGKLAAPLIAGTTVIGGLTDLAQGKKVESVTDVVPEGWNKLNPFEWAMRGGMFVGEGFNKLYGGMSEKFGGSGSLGGDIHDLINKPAIPKFAEGGIVTKPTLGLVGEGNSSEAIIPLNKLDDIVGKKQELLIKELETLNKQTAEMIVYMRETSEYTKRNLDATRSLNGDLFR